MPYALDLLLDPATDASIRSAWDVVVAAGIAPAPPDSGNFPHVTLGVCDDADVAKIAEPLRELAAATDPMAIMFSSVGVFPGHEPVIFLAPVVTAELLDLHARFHALFSRYVTRPWEHYEPGRWVPHCTLAMKFAPARTAEALAACTMALPIRARLEQISLVTFYPARFALCYPLGPNPRPAAAGGFAR